MKSRTVCLIPTHPGEGWRSMNRYWTSLTKAFEEIADPDFEFRCPIPSGRPTERPRGRFSRILARKVTYPLAIARMGRFPIHHLLDHSYGGILNRLLPGGAKIVTVHDVLPIYYSEHLTEGQVSRFRKNVEQIRTADAIVAISEATRRDIVEHIGIDEKKTVVVPNGVDWDYWSAAGSVEVPKIEGPYLLSVGNTLKRKNLWILPEMLAEVRKSIPGTKLVRVGKQLPEELLGEFRLKTGPTSLIEEGIVSDERLRTLYRGAAATVMPSRYEGFGLPVLEAMAAGCPVVCANASSLPEAGGKAALYFDPDLPAEAAAKVIQLINDSEFRSQLTKAGCERAASFTWQRHGEELLKIYRKLAP